MSSSSRAAAAILSLAGRCLLAALFLVSALRSLDAVSGTAGYLGRLGVPLPGIAAWLVIAVEIVGALMLIVGWRSRLAAWALIAFVVVASLLAHRFWSVDATQFANQLNHFLKNLAVIGGLLYVAVHGPGRLALGSR